VLGVNTNQLTSLSDVPHGFIKRVFSHETRMLLEETINCVVVVNGR
jgi:hypothetical protein